MFGSLGDRVARIDAIPQEPPVDTGDVAGETSEPAPVPESGVVDGQGERREVQTCHVWVDGTHAGILTSWWRPTTVWFGEVAWTPPDQPGAVALDWVEASRLRQG